jgi:glucose/arabinose dehydrogenase
MMLRALVVLLAACGGKAGADAAIGSGSDAPLPVACTTPISGTNITMRRIANIAAPAMLVTSPPDDPRLFVVAQTGQIWILLPDGSLVPHPFLDIAFDAPGPVQFGGEQGLLGLAFHPAYATNGQFYTFYTKGSGSSRRDVLITCKVSADPLVADRASCREMMSIPDFASNHNGGMLEFGSDGYLYISTGDGGGGGDPHRNGQALVDGGDLDSVALLAKILRIDVDKPADGKLYGIPPDNPFAAGGGAPEIWILGTRNEWRWTFDRETGDMWLADVGQNEWEELTVLRPAQQKGANLGWSVFEGTHCFREPCDATGMVMPQFERHHSTGWASIIGGQVYRGTCYSDLVGWYFFTDYEKHGLAKARLLADDTLEVEELPGNWPAVPASIHAGANGELYETDTNGNVFHLEAGP